MNTAPSRPDLHGLNLCDRHYQKLLFMKGEPYRSVINMAATYAVEDPCHVSKCACEH